MNFADLTDLTLHWREDGDPAGLPVVFAGPLGLGLDLWDPLIERLPQQGFRYIRYDLRGHGRSDMSPGPWSMGALVRDAERLLGHLGVRDCVFVGLSLGGMIAQGLAVKRPDLIRSLVLSNTAVKSGTPATWATRMAQVKSGGMEALETALLTRWFGRGGLASQGAHIARGMLLSMKPEAYIAGCQAISGTDFFTPTAGLRLPALVIAGALDGATPPDLMRELAELIEGAEFALIRSAGHLPMLERPDDYAEVIGAFLLRSRDLAAPQPVVKPVAQPHDHHHDENCGCGGH